jgi:signal transduction histidine kinase
MTVLTLAPADRVQDRLLRPRATGAGREAQAEAARHADRALTATVSHDLKNALAVVKGRTQLLRRGLARQDRPDLDQLDDGLAQIERATCTMLAMIDELTDLSDPLSTAVSARDYGPTDLVALTRRVASEYQELTERHQIRVRATAAAIVGNWEATRLERVVVNLLSNAIKYSPNGGEIDLTVAWDKTPSPPWAVLRVRDRGIGIPCADLPRIFERFHRARNAVERAPGTGVGLMAVRQIVEHYGGSVSVRSREGRWSKFTIRLPLDPLGEPSWNAAARSHWPAASGETREV